MGVYLVIACEPTATGGSAVINRLLDQDPRTTGILTLDELAAPGLIAGACARRMNLPDDLSIVGIAISEQAALMSTPALTTVSANEHEMGQLRVELLIRRIEGEAGQSCHRLFEGTLQRRGSSGHARSAHQAHGRDRSCS